MYIIGENIHIISPKYTLLDLVLKTYLFLFYNNIIINTNNLFLSNFINYCKCFIDFFWRND